MLFDYLVAPQLLFRGIEGVFKSVLRRELKFLDEMDASLYDSGVAAKAEAAENAGQEEKDGVAFWNLLDTFLESYPGIKSSSISRDLTDRNSLSSNDKKLEIVKKINKIKKKEYLINIFKIITRDNNEYTENNNGIFIFFHNLSDDVYDKIDTYINYIYKIHKCNNTDSQYINSITNDDIVN